MKVFEIKELGETTHIAFDGDSSEALEWYVEETMCDKNEIASIGEVPQEEWSKITIYYEEDGGFTTTIAEKMAGQVSPIILCSTAYL